MCNSNSSSLTSEASVSELTLCHMVDYLSDSIMIKILVEKVATGIDHPQTTNTFSPEASRPCYISGPREPLLPYLFLNKSDYE